MMRGIPEHWMDRVAAELRRPVRVSGDFDDKVMAEIRAMPRHRFGAWARAMRPRTITVSPLVSGIAAALLIAVTLSVGHVVATLRTSRQAPPRLDVAGDRSASPRVAHKRAVQFVLVAPT